MDLAAKLCRGAIDTHIHFLPDIIPRKMDAIELAREAKQAGMRGIILKSHYTLTADLAFLVEKVIPGIDVWGGIALNTPVGGINPVAVKTAIGLGAKIVWMPTISAQNHRRKLATSKVGPLLKSLGGEELGEGIRIRDEGGNISSELGEVLKEIARANIILATGHLSVQEIKILVEEAIKLGVRKILVNHPELDIINMSLDDQLVLAKKGVYFERCFFVTTSLGQRMNPARIAEAIRRVGAESTILATDFGQADNPSPVKGLKSYVRSMLKEGITEKEINLMVRVNPCELLKVKRRRPEVFLAKTTKKEERNEK